MRISGVRRAGLLVLVAVALVGSVAGCVRSAARAATVSTPAAPARPSAAPPPPAPTITYPRAGSGQWHVAAGDSPVAGRSGTLLRFRVAVEADVAGVDPDAFAADVVATLADPRSWAAGGQWRLQRVGPGQQYDFTVYLATPATRDALCGDGVDGYTSCRQGNSVVLNVARWAHGVPDYGAPLDVYRQYMVDHEVGHRLGHQHELCPGPGQPAPVMEQQTLGLHGCVANPWPYVNGQRYAGHPGAYDDPVPDQP